MSNLISFYDKVTCLVDEGKAVDDVYLHFCKVFVTVSQSICPGAIGCLEKLNGCTVHWVENWVHGWAQRVLEDGIILLNGIIPVNGANPGRTAVPPQNLHPRMRNYHIWT